MDFTIQARARDPEFHCRDPSRYGESTECHQHLLCQIQLPLGSALGKVRVGGRTPGPHSLPRTPSQKASSGFQKGLSPCQALGHPWTSDRRPRMAPAAPAQRVVAGWRRPRVRVVSRQLSLLPSAGRGHADAVELRPRPASPGCSGSEKPASKARISPASYNPVPLPTRPGHTHSKTRGPTCRAVTGTR